MAGFAWMLRYQSQDRPRPAMTKTSPAAGYLLYCLVASWLRRAAAALAVVALLFGLVRDALSRRQCAGAGDPG
ncbi:MAG: hypothetical protein DLM61_16785 [Pseudonocardiales bacterium]|nr:MAG: hypothetical protein DLM61_16785 [Pseudonocardiales bacterium]